ncbi:ras-associating and dilute domain-containing protein-like isoform X2 [Acipenser ruthenus]|uniref:ras-associating and dilute domain-containing protein-like isoform X2 n=1 Tax=Acipenser ruthenus TaxID=7906 RepID=UPI0027407F81|nr:ras-associating and dilute domain-containing protein-like isoform X2 [Acipenser ruthenus]
MFYGSSASMSLPSKKKLKRQSRTFTQVLYRTLSYRDRRSVTDINDQVADDPAELSTQTSVPGVLKIFGDEICIGANYKSVLATPRSSAQELVKEALERYSLNKAAACEYLLCDVIGRFEGADKRWRTECLRALGDNEKPLLLQDLWKPKEGFARRFELRRRAEVEEMAAREKDTVTAGPLKQPHLIVTPAGRGGNHSAGRSPQFQCLPMSITAPAVCSSSYTDINAQARKLQRNRAKGTTTLSPGESFCRSLSETSLNLTGRPGDEPKRYYSTLPGPLRGRAGREGSHYGRKKEEGSHYGRKKEEREGGGVRHSLYHSPHLLLLQGFDQRNDCLVYLLNRDQHTVGQETASARPNICLSSPDVLQLHCKIKKIQVVRRLSQTVEERLVVEPLPQASVLINFSRADHTTQLRHGDLLSFGAHYIFLYKDPVSAKPLPTQTLSRLKILFQLPEPELDLAAPLACKMCGSVFKEKPPQQQPVRRSFKPHLIKSKSLQRRKLHLDFEKAQEDELIGRIISLIEPGGDDHKLTPAYLLCLCIKHSATAFEAGSFGKLLLKIVKRIQSIAWEKTKELAEKQAQHQDAASLSLLNVTDLVPDLQLILFWMSNSIEILYYIQQKTPGFLQGMEQLDVKGSKVSLLSTAISANEEAMTILEEVIMYTFQQCVYYITKAENSDPCWRGGSPALPEPVRKVVLIYQTTLDLLQQYQVHSEVQSQMFAYLFFFTNVSLFNQLLDKGPLRGWFHWSRGVQIQGSLRLVLEWAGNAGLSHLAEEFFSKFSSAVSLLATPTLQLVQMTWKSLCSDYPALKPAQLHHLLTKYQLAPDAGPILAWQPSPEEEAQIYRTVDLLESFENHPPIVLPSSGFQVDFESDTVDDNIYRQLLYVRHFLWSLRAKSPSTNGSTDSQELQREPPLSHSSPRPAAPIGHSTPTNHHHSGSHLETQPDGRVSVVSNLSSGPRDGQCHEDRLKERLNHVLLQGNLGRNSSFLQSLLTPPNTLLYTDLRQQDSAPPNRGGRTIHDVNKGLNSFTVNGVEGNNSDEVIDFPTPVSSSLSSAADDFCYVFIVELDKGPFGLGMGLIDGLHTPLNAPGIYIRTLIPDGPAASDGRLNIGDRILAVNGTSLIGADYQSAVDLIRVGGGRLRFLVAKSDMEISEKISASSC